MLIYAVECPSFKHIQRLWQQPTITEHMNALGFMK